MKNFLLKLSTLTLVVSTALCIGTACKTEEEQPHEHTYSETWTIDYDYHYKKATCEHTEEYKDKGNHTYENNVCTVCGYAKEAPGLVMELNSDGQGYTVSRDYSSTETNIVIPATYKGKPVTVVGGYGSWQNVVSVVIPEGVKRIDANTFYQCSTLASVTLPNGLESIGHAAFGQCTSLTEIVIPDSVTDLDQAAFISCKNLKNVTLGNGIKSIYNAFNGCTSLTNVTLPEGLETIKTSAFENCSSLTKIVIPNNVKTIGDYAFRGCTNLYTVTIGESVEDIKTGAFRDCYKLVEVVNKSPNLTVEIDEYNGHVGKYALKVFNSGSTYVNVFTTDDNGFVTCGNILTNYVGTEKEITIPSNITKIHAGAFYGNTNITDVVIPDSVTGIGQNAFRNCENLTNITIGNKVAEVGFYAFENCEKLEKVVYTGTADTWAKIVFNKHYEEKDLDMGGIVSANPLSYAKELYISNNLVTTINLTSVQTVNKYVFFGYEKLTSVTLGASVTKVDEEAFANCKNLESIIIGNNVSLIRLNSLTGCGKLESVTFSDTSTWYRTDSEYNAINKKNGTETDVTNVATNATYFKDTYKEYLWYKK